MDLPAAISLVCGMSEAFNEAGKRNQCELWGKDEPDLKIRVDLTVFDGGGNVLTKRFGKGQVSHSYKETTNSFKTETRIAHILIATAQRNPRKWAAGLTIWLRIHTHCLAVVCLQTTRRGRLDDENAPCSGTAVCDVYRNSPLFMPSSAIISTRSGTFTHATISRSTAPLLSPSGVKSAQPKRLPIPGN